ncbi:MAG: SGNH/GDSL hydrolase family protein [Chloroflexota bacterium]|nr:SGNH/GDSL hydrolase family protein [Chloroflexota bacterium]
MKSIRWLIAALIGMVALTAAAFAQAPPTPFDAAVVAQIDLAALPILPAVTDTARAIYAAGQDADRDGGAQNPRAFSKLGDCMTAAAYFLTYFGMGEYELGAYAALQPTIDYFSVRARPEGDYEGDSFANPGLATASGFNTTSVLDPLWSDPTWCAPGESPLACEFRVTRPAFALIMFGTNDVFFFDAAQFDTYYRQIVDETIAAGVVPVLYTIPERPEFPDKTVLFNQIIAQIAADQDLPLINLYLALDDLPDRGVDPVEPIHLSLPTTDNAATFTTANLRAGYTLRNLLTLQMLDALRVELNGGA